MRIPNWLKMRSLRIRVERWRVNWSCFIKWFTPKRKRKKPQKPGLTNIWKVVCRVMPKRPICWYGLISRLWNRRSTSSNSNLHLQSRSKESAVRLALLMLWPSRTKIWQLRWSSCQESKSDHRPNQLTKENWLTLCRRSLTTHSSYRLSIRASEWALILRRVTAAFPCKRRPPRRDWLKRRRESFRS